MSEPTDKDGEGRESSDAWLEDLDESSELAEFHGAASALGEFRDSSVPFEPQEAPSSEVDELSGLDSALDDAFDDVPSTHQAGMSPLPSTSPIPTMAPGASPIPTMAPGSTPVPEAFEPPSPGRGRRGWVIPAIAIAAILGISAVVVTVIVTRQPERPDDEDEQPSQFILIKGQVFPEDGISRTRDAAATSPDGAHKAVVTPIGIPEAGPSKSRDGGTAKVVRDKTVPSPDQGTDVSKAFASQRGRIAKCFETHAQGDQNVPSLNIDFTVSADGAVEHVLLQPESMRGTPLGNCLQGVAQSTRFPAPGKTVDFRIPIKARRVE